jgi:hypothetical protein
MMKREGMIAGDFEIGSDVYFSLSESFYYLPKRVIGKLIGYDIETVEVELLYGNIVFKQKHTLEFGGISGVLKC